MSKSKMFALTLATLVLVIAAACAPAAAVLPTADTAMMAKETESAARMMKETGTAMMAKETKSAAMMMKETDTAMMAKETESAAMMMKETDTAMMVKETESAALMMKETDTAMMVKETESAALMMKETDTAMMAKETESAMMSKTPGAMTLPPQQFAAHFVDSMPMHDQVLTQVPELVRINFNFTLSSASKITIEKDGKEIMTGAGELGDKKLTMTSTVPQDMGPGVYLVKYQACWPDNSCHDGQFAFIVK